MDDESSPGGYGSSSGPARNPNDFGSNFISFGAADPSESFHKQWRPRGGRGGQPQLISGSRGYHRPFQGGPGSGPPRGGRGWNNRGFNDWGPNQNQQFQHRRGGPFRGGGRGGGFDHHRGNRHQRHQGQQSSESAQDISSYYHPSMVEDPWAELEKLLGIAQSDEQNPAQPESSRNAERENVDDDEESNHSENSDSSE